MKRIYSFIFLFFTWGVLAACPLGEASLTVKNYAQAQQFFKGCALVDNDAQAQYALARLYQEGFLPGAEQKLQTLKYLRFAAENGYGPAQYELALLMLDFLRTPEGQAVLSHHSEQQRQIKIQRKQPLLQMSPLAWMLLAAERAENKWFYTAPPVYVPQAEQALKDAHLTPFHLKEIQMQATQWKQNKLLHVARQIMTEAEWQRFFPMPTEPAAASQQQDAFVAFVKNKLQNYTLYK